MPRKKTVNIPPRTAYGRPQDYRWLDKDPIVDVLRNLIQKDGRTPSELADKARLARGTVLGLFFGNTRKPHHSTVTSLASALGYKIHWTATGSPTIIIPPYQKTDPADLE